MTWPTTPARFVLTEVDERGLRPGEDGELLSVSEYRGVVPRATSASQQAASEDTSHYKRCQPGQLVLNRLWAFRGGLGVSPLTGLVSPDYAVFDIDPSMDPRFVHYQTRSTWFVAEMTKRLRGIGSPDASNGRAPRINTGDLGRIDMFTPPLDVQRRVVCHIDMALARSRAVREKNNELATALDKRLRAHVLALLARYASSAPMVPVQYAFEVWPGATPKADDGNWGGGIAWATPTDLRPVNGRVLVGTDRTLTPAGVASKGLRLAPAGSVVISCRAPVGYAAVTSTPTTSNQGCKLLVPQADAEGHFLALQLYARTDELQGLGRGTTFDELSTRAVSQFRVVLPPPAIQRQIVAEVEAARGRTDAVLAAVAEQTRLLGVHDASMLTAAVTGQLPV